MSAFDEAFLGEEGILARNDAGVLIRVEDVTEDDLYKRVVIWVDGKRVAVPLALPMLDELGTPQRGNDGGYLPRRATLYDAVSLRYATALESSGRYPIPTVGREIAPIPTDRNPVPILCHQPHLNPVGVCRVCSIIVERPRSSEGSESGSPLEKAEHVGPTPGLAAATTYKAEPKLAASCITPLTQDMHGIRLFTPCKGSQAKPCEVKGEDPTGNRQKAARHVRTLLSLLAANHLFTDDAPPAEPDPRFRNELLELCEQFGVVPRSGRAPEPTGLIPLPEVTRRGFLRAERHLEKATIPLVNGWSHLPYVDDSSEVIKLDRNDCILCDRCVRACSEVKPFKVIGHSGFGKVAGISFGLNMLMAPGEFSGCVSCGECATACPTGALEFQAEVYETIRTRTSKDVKGLSHAIPRIFPNTLSPASQANGRDRDLQLFTFPAFTSSSSGAPQSREEIPKPGRQKQSLVASHIVTAAQLIDDHQSTDFIAQLFKKIPRSFLRWNQGAVRELTTGPLSAVLCYRGDYGSVAFILVSGSITVYLPETDGEKSSHQITLSYPDKSAPPVTILGEMACMTHKPRTATLVAHRDTRVWIVRRNLLHILQRSWYGHDLLSEMYRRRALQLFFESGNLFDGLSRSFSSECVKALQQAHQKLGPFVPLPLPPVVEEALATAASFLRGWTPDLGSKSHVQAVMPGLESWIVSGTPPGRTPDWLDPLQEVPAFAASLPALRNAWKQFAKACADYHRQSIELLQYRPGKVIVRQGDEADSFFVMYMGHVQVAVTDTSIYPNRSRIVGDHGPGGHFGETALLSELFPGITAEFTVKPNQRTATVTALDHVEVVRIGFEALKKLLNERPLLRTTLEARALSWLRSNRSPRPAAAERHDQFLSGQELYQGKDLLVIDLNKCTRCNECVKACAGAHDDGVTRLLLEGNRLDRFLIPSACRSCHDPACLVGCPVDAIHRDTSDSTPAISDSHKRARAFAIRITNDCIGCGLCAHNCPFGSIHMVPTDIVGGTHGKALVDQKQQRLATNCDLCHTLDGTPRCVHHCPHDAAKRMDSVKFAELLGIPTSFNPLPSSK